MSKETLSKKTARTKWVHRVVRFSRLSKTISWMGLVGVVIILVLLTLPGVFFVKDSPYKCNYKYSIIKKVYVNDNEYQAEIANTDQQRQKGLSDRQCIPSNTVMLFEFDQPSKYGIWMKDMKFAIDIIWLANDKSVVYFEQNIGPDTYPRVFTPTQTAKYVLEIKAGQVARLNIKLGDTVTW